MFPTDPVVQPPLPVFPVGPATSPVACDTLGPLPCPGPEGSPFGPARVPHTGPGSDPRSAPSTLAPPARRPAGACPPATCSRSGSRVGVSNSGPTNTLRLVGARLPATCLASAAAFVSTSGPLFAEVTYTTGDVFPACDTDPVAAAPSYLGRDAGVPRSAPSPTPTSCSPNGDTTRGCYLAAPGSCSDA